MPYVKKHPEKTNLGRPRGAKKSAIASLGDSLKNLSSPVVVPASSASIPNPIPSVAPTPTKTVDFASMSSSTTRDALKTEANPLFNSSDQTEDISSLFKDLHVNVKSPEETEKEKVQTDKSLDGVFQAIENMWNRAGEKNSEGQNEPWKWTSSDSSQLKNSIMLLDAKYNFIGKSMNYIPEILFAVTLAMIAFKGIALMKHRRESPTNHEATHANSSFSEPPPVDSYASSFDELRERARKRAQDLGGQ